MITAIWLLLHAVVASTQAAGLGANTPDGVAGTWEVREVAVDHQDQQHWRFRPNDPKLVAADKLAVNLDNQVLLILQRRLSDAKPTPSFDCGKAATPTENAICGNFDLASWDRSVALALHQAIARSPDKEASLRGGQRDWLKKRDECAAKVECIDEQQWRRVEDLGQE